MNLNYHARLRETITGNQVGGEEAGGGGRGREPPQPWNVPPYTSSPSWSLMGIIIPP